MALQCIHVHVYVIIIGGARLGGANDAYVHGSADQRENGGGSITGGEPRKQSGGKVCKLMKLDPLHVLIHHRPSQ